MNNMKPCKPVYEHIDQDEFGDGRKITTSLLERYCKNISGLWKKTEELEDNTDPELRKRFTPPLIHDMHSYGTQLNNNNEYEFDNSTETIFLDAIGLKTIEIQASKLKEEKEDGAKELYTYEFETTHTIAKIAINTEENEYPLHNTLDKLKDSTKLNGYYIDEKKIYIKPLGNEKIEKLLLKVHSDDPYIDRKNTTAYIDLSKNKIHAPYSEDQFEEERIDQNTAEQYTFDTTTGKVTSTIRGVEKYWNFGWRKFNHFWMYPLWLQDPFAENPNTPPIPTVARAFIITPRNSGILTRIRLMFNVKNGAEDEVYVEIRTLTREGKPSTKILAREKTRIRGAKQSLLHTINFSTPPMLEKSKRYAVVLRAGFTSPDKSYGLGGWSYITYPGEALANIGKKTIASVTNVHFKWKHIFDFDDDIFSDVFWSIDNCVSWNKVHPVLEGILDGMGARAFSYQTYIKPLKPNATLMDGESYAYWKPIKTNPIQSVQLVPSTQGEKIEWEISTNMIDWHQVKHPNWSYNFQEDGARHEKGQNQLYIRAKITSTKTNNPASAPEITGLKVILKTIPAGTAYLKTLFYNPRFGNLLGPSMWSKLGIDVELKPPKTENVDVNVDVILNKIMKDTLICNGRSMTFKLSEKPSKPLVRVTMLPSILYLPQNEEQITPTIPTPTPPEENKKTLEALQTILTRIDGMYEKIKNNTTNTTSHPQALIDLAAHFTNVDGIINKLRCNPKSLLLLKDSVTPFKKLDTCNTSECLLNSITILRNVILNAINLIKTPEGKYINVIPEISGRECTDLELTENRDYTVNYKEGTITLNDAWGIGELKVEYYPLWIQGLKLEDFPFRMDFLKETFKNTQTLTLKTVPLDPIRSVEQYNKEKNEWTELTQERDYHVQYDEKKIIIHKNEGEKEYRVRYTPYLVDEGLALAYRMKRENPEQQATIQSCYFQNRV